MYRKNVLQPGRDGCVQPLHRKSKACLRLLSIAVGLAFCVPVMASPYERAKDSITGHQRKMYLSVSADGGTAAVMDIDTTERPQRRMLKGVVLDTAGRGLPDASVTVMGMRQGVRTDGQGQFSLEAPIGAVLTISFVGMASQTIDVTEALASSGIKVTLGPGGVLKELGDVVVVGYGTQSKTAVTGSIASVKFDQFKDRSYSNVTQALSGEIAGVSITQSQGAPGSSPMIKIRGTSSITAGTNPLYVVDGMPMENFDMNLINPQDIASVDVLKDASSAAIYGSRGANGVIIITTKLGQAGKSAVRATYEFGVQQVDRRIDLMNAAQYVQYYVDAHNNAWTDIGGSASDPNDKRGPAYRIPEDFIQDPGQFEPGTDWQSVMFRTAPSHHAEVSVSGGNEKTQFLFSAGYLDQQAVLDMNYYKRLSLRANIRHEISEKVTAGVKLAVTGIFDRTQGTSGKSDVVSLGLQSDPIFPVYNENGNYGFRDPNSKWYRFTPYSDLIMWHPYSLTREIKEQRKTFNTLATGFLEYAPTKDLTFKTSLNGNLMNNRDNSYRNKNQKYGYSSNLPAQGWAGSAYSFNW
ncbi:MAG TPA: SusC/RagA family TonB-linked outer membrane protein, partial [Arachidicoccus sp.]|nr:SusC/RagA family TonB-linked outer membrane protein [Arachidicoccus sp.]